MMNPHEYRNAICIDSNGELQLLADLIEPWQEQDFTAMDGGWSQLAGIQVDSPCRRAWLERSRGHSKTSDIALMVLWALVFSPDKLTGIAAAADKDQGKILRDAIERLVASNGWSQIIDVQQLRVVNKKTGSTLEIISSDAMSSYGLLVDFIVCDELTHWPRRDLWDSLLSTAAKKARCLLLVITNAGWTDSWQYETRELIRESGDWYFSRQEGPVASWITPDRLAEQQLLLPDIAFRRLWLNQWSSGCGDALTGEAIDSAVCADHAPMMGSEEGFAFAAGLDLGIRRDKSALCVLGKDRAGKLKLAYTRTWAPTVSGTVDLMEVEDCVRTTAARFRCGVAYDPWQSELMRQRLRDRVPMREVTFSGSNLQAMATATLEAFNSRNITLYPDGELLADLRKLRVIEKSYGFRLESPRDGAGHGDLATAFQLALLAIKTIQPAKRSGSLPASSPALVPGDRGYRRPPLKRVF